MKKFAAVLGLLVLVTLSGVTEAKPGKGGRFGLGLILGEPSSVTAKLFFDRGRKTALNVGVFYSFSNHFGAYGDFLWHFHRLFSGVKEKVIRQFSPYIGVGGAAGFFDRGGRFGGTTIAAWVRVPVGLGWYPRAYPFEIFVELVPAIVVIPTIDLDLMGGIGARFYF